MIWSSGMSSTNFQGLWSVDQQKVLCKHQFENYHIAILVLPKVRQQVHTNKWNWWMLPEYRHCRTYGPDKHYSDLTICPLAVTLDLGVWTCVWYVTHCLVMIYTSMKFHQIMFSSSWVRFQTKMRGGWMHGQTMCVMDGCTDKQYVWWTDAWTIICSRIFFGEQKIKLKKAAQTSILFLPETESNKLGCGCWIRMMFL